MVIARHRQEFNTPGTEDSGEGSTTNDESADELPVDGRTYLREINHPITTPMAIPTAMDPTTVSTGCRPRRLVVSSKNSSATSPACFATRRAPPKPSSAASAIADVRRDAVRAVSAICSPALLTTVSDIVSLLFDWMLISIKRRYGKGMVVGYSTGAAPNSLKAVE